MDRALTVVHGHTLKRIEELILRSLPEQDSPLYIKNVMAGGMSNINLRGLLGALEIVIKLPSELGPFFPDYYERLFSVTKGLHSEGIAPKPMAYGLLDDVNETPFIIMEFVEGAQCHSLIDFSLSEIVKTVILRDKMTQLKPPDLPSYSPQGYIQSVFMPLRSMDALFSLPERDVNLLLDRFMGAEDMLRNHSESITDWRNDFMHGDFHEGNIVFTNEDAILLDFEYSAMGDSKIDLAYLRIQPEIPYPNRIMASLTKNEVYTESFQKFEPLALSFAISWTLKNLRLLDAGCLEQNAMKGYNRSQLLNYAKAKLVQLDELLPT